MNTPAKSSKSDDDAEAIANEIAQLRKDLGSLVETVGKIGKSRAEGAAKAASTRVAEAKASGEAVLKDIEGELRSVEREIVAATRDSPFRALGLAMLAGFVAGFLFRR